MRGEKRSIERTPSDQWLRNFPPVLQINGYPPRLVLERRRVCRQRASSDTLQSLIQLRTPPPKTKTKIDVKY